MSVVSRSFLPVSLQGGRCPADKRHFQGAAREVYGYLKLLAAKHGGFVFASIGDIARHTKNWKQEKQSYCYRQCVRILKTLEALGILSERRKVKIHGRTYWGRQFADHLWWAETHGDICDFKQWLEYEKSFQEDKQQNVTPDVTEEVIGNVTADVLKKTQNVTANVTRHERKIAAIV